MKEENNIIKIALFIALVVLCIWGLRSQPIREIYLIVGWIFIIVLSLLILAAMVTEKLSRNLGYLAWDNKALIKEIRESKDSKKAKSALIFFVFKVVIISIGLAILVGIIGALLKRSEIYVYLLASFRGIMYVGIFAGVLASILTLLLMLWPPRDDLYF